MAHQPTTLWQRLRARRTSSSPREESWELRQILLLGQLISLAAVGFTAGIAMWPFALIAGVGLTYGHRYAHRQKEGEPNKRVRALIFGGIHFAVCFMLFGIAVGLPYPQAIMAMWGMALISWELFTRRHIYLGWLFGLANIYVTAILSRSTIFILFLLLFTAVFAIFLSVLERVEAEKEGYKSLEPLTPFNIQIAALWERLQRERRTPRGRFAGRFAAFTLLFTLIVFVLTPHFAGTPLIPPVSLRVPMRGGPQGQIVNPSAPLVRLEGYDPDEVDNQSSDYYHGFDSRLDLSYRGGLDRTIMMYVRSPVYSYWRSHAYDQYDGRTWVQSRAQAPTVLRRGNEDLHFTLNETPPPGNRFVQTYFIRTPLPNIAFCRWITG